MISSSAGELQPVFEAVLENATRLCAAKFGNLYLCEGDAFRTTAMHNVPPAFAEVRRRDPLVHPEPGSLLRRLVDSRSQFTFPTLPSSEPISNVNRGTSPPLSLAASAPYLGCQCSRIGASLEQ